ncbi:MAG TPA: VWA domain-containing protein [Phycisphaerae bacterium]|nr:VWA domain-containing protein [Phycisphaerae bacterium]
MNIRFDNLAYLHLLWAVPALAAVVWYGQYRKQRALRAFATWNLHAHLLPQVSVARQWVRSILVLAAMVAIVLGAVGPRWGVTYEDVPRRGIDIMFVLDVSRSMLAEDIKPNRLERAKQAIDDVLQVLGGDRVGLVTFAGTAVLNCPLTINYSAFRMTLDEVGPLTSTRGGTLIGDAVRLAADSFVDPIKQYKAIIVITDGEDQESYPVEAATKAFQEKGIRVFTVGLGSTDEGARIPMEKNGQRLYLQYDGQEVWSKMNPEPLRQMAIAGGGAYVPAGTSNFDLGQQIYLDKIAQGEQREFEATRIERYKPRFQWFAGAALVLLLTASLMRETRGDVEASDGEHTGI